uniref:Uncharacterized protein n=1 Tax=Vitis vinifera TaxID=29760 RepID=F6H191_VITVI
MVILSEVGSISSFPLLLKLALTANTTQVEENSVADLKMISQLKQGNKGFV